MNYTVKKFICFLNIVILLLLIMPINLINASALNISKVSINNSKKIVYLTFDDGPSPFVTNKILDVLKEYDVKATFFVVGKEIPNRENILKRIYQDGHSIGLHSYHHNVKKLYKSEDNFIQEMLMTRNIVNEVTGFAPNILRFPGGSSERLTSKMLQELHKHNFKIYDWNVNLEDGIKPDLPVSAYINNAKNYKEYYNRLIVLLHCNYNNVNTAKALPGVIEYYRSLGYEIKPIDDATNEYYYRVKR